MVENQKNYELQQLQYELAIDDDRYHELFESAMEEMDKDIKNNEFTNDEKKVSKDIAKSTAKRVLWYLNNYLEK